MSDMKSTLSADKHDLVIERTFDAPREKVWKAWIDQQLVAKWWAPEGFSNPVCEWEPKPGGKIYIEMQDDIGAIQKGSRYPMDGTFKEVSEPERLVFTSHALMDGKPIIESETTVTFEESGNKTKLIIHVVVTNATPEAEGPLSGMQMGWNQQIDKLANLLNA